MFKCGFVGIVGKPNVGKSTLLNKLVGYKVSITAPKPQTTRFNIKGIITSDKSQIIFVDTPGVHNPKHKLGKYMMENVDRTLQNVDVLIYLVDATKPRLDDISKTTIQNLIQSRKKIILCINKVEKVDKAQVFKIIDEYDKYIKTLNYIFTDIIPISVFKGTNLDILISTIENNLPIEQMLYSEEDITDLTEREIVEEIIREKALKYLNEEIPHGINVSVNSFKERKNKKSEQIYDIDADIVCEKESHKPIIIGKNGEMLKQIATSARVDIENNLDTKINLKLWVKVRPNWQENENYFKNIKNK